MFKLKKYDTIDEIVLACYSSDEQQVTLEDLEDSMIVGFTQNQEDITFDYKAQKEGMEAQGVWGWIDDEKTIHYWIGKELSMEELIHFFAHEVGHGTATHLEDDFEEEMRAEDFGHVATMAYKLALEVKNKGHKNEEVKTNTVTKKTWEEFRNTGLLLIINQLLHVFGWALVFEIEEEKVRTVYPARVTYRGFSEESVDQSYKKVSQYLKDNIEDINKEAQS